MLSELNIENFALIDRAHLRFGHGLNVITGETGAGKSIILGALSLVLGAKASKDLIRQGAEFARVEARFTLHQMNENQEAFEARLREQGLEPDADGDLIIRRTVVQEGEDKKTGKNQILINGRLTTRSSLMKLTEGLVDLCGQREHQILLNPDHHRIILDHLCGESALLSEMTESFEKFKELFLTFKDLSENRNSHLQRKDFLGFQIKEIDTIAPKADEDRDVEEELKKLSHAEELHEILSESSRLLDAEGDGEAGGAGLRSSFSALLNHVRRSLRLLPENKPLMRVAALFEQAQIHCQEAKDELDDFVEHLEVNPEGVRQLESRLQILHQLERKHGLSLAEILLQREKLEEEYDAIRISDEEIADLKITGQKQLTQAMALATKLHQIRKKTADAVRKKIQKELHELGMTDAQFQVDLSCAVFDKLTFPVDPEQTGLSRHGGDLVRFLLAPNPGEGFHPLDQIASGGELSRILLALKAVLSPAEFSGTYLFDEIDTGVGGVTGKLLGQKLKVLSRQRQVICITHLPQIACFADQHLEVCKTKSQGRTLTKIETLSKEERVEELARMLGVEKDSFTDQKHAYAHARKLLHDFGPRSPSE